MTSQRKKFSSQMDVDLHKDLQTYAANNKVEFQQVLEEAGELFLMEKGVRRKRPDVVAIARQIAEEMPETLAYLAK